MKSKFILFACILVFFATVVLAFGRTSPYPHEEPWTQAELLAPADLAKVLADPHAKQPIVLCIGPGAVIKGSIYIGPARDSGNLAKLRQRLSEFPKDAPIVIYCGCCPFVHCPNIRPAFTLLKDMKFTQPKLLNLEHNVKVDWMDKGFPITP
jgi:thiosulfate/3-mercaptopyruvate sulfurtransferase